MYERAAGTPPGVDRVSTPVAELRGPKTDIGFVAGVARDPVRKEKYTVNNDGSDSAVDAARGLLFVASRGDREGEGIVGVWNVADSGDVPPKYVIP